jgi:hypothetical protein
MSLSDAAVYASVATLVAATFYVRRRISGRKRLWLGVVLLVIGWAGILLGLRLSDLPIFQSEVFAYAWMGLFAAAVVLAILFIVTASFDWLGLTRPHHQRRQFPPFS